MAQRGKKIAIKDVLEKHWACENGLLETAIYAYKEGNLKISLWIRCLKDIKSFNYIIQSLN